MLATNGWWQKAKNPTYRSIYSTTISFTNWLYWFSKNLPPISAIWQHMALEFWRQNWFCHVSMFSSRIDFASIIDSNLKLESVVFISARDFYTQIFWSTHFYVNLLTHKSLYLWHTRTKCNTNPNLTSHFKYSLHI